MARLCLLLSVLIPYKSSLILLITNIYSWTPCTRMSFIDLLIHVHHMVCSYNIQVCAFLSLLFPCWGSNPGSCICEESTGPLGYILATSTFCGLLRAMHVSVSVGEWLPNGKCCPVSLSARRPWTNLQWINFIQAWVLLAMNSVLINKHYILNMVSLSRNT